MNKDVDLATSYSWRGFSKLCDRQKHHTRVLCLGDHWVSAKRNSIATELGAQKNLNLLNASNQIISGLSYCPEHQLSNLGRIKPGSSLPSIDFVIVSYGLEYLFGPSLTRSLQRLCKAKSYTRVIDIQRVRRTLNRLRNDMHSLCIRLVSDFPNARILVNHYLPPPNHKLGLSTGPFVKCELWHQNALGIANIEHQHWWCLSSILWYQLSKCLSEITQKIPRVYHIKPKDPLNTHDWSSDLSLSKSGAKRIVRDCYLPFIS